MHNVLKLSAVRKILFPTVNASGTCTYGNVRLVGDLISMRVEWRCASTTSGGQCVMTAGAALMLQWFCKQLGYAYTGSEWKVLKNVSVLVQAD